MCKSYSVFFSLLFFNLQVGFTQPLNIEQLAQDSVSVSPGDTISTGSFTVSDRGEGVFYALKGKVEGIAYDFNGQDNRFRISSNGDGLLYSRGLYFDGEVLEGNLGGISAPPFAGRHFSRFSADGSLFVHSSSGELFEEFEERYIVTSYNTTTAAYDAIVDTTPLITFSLIDADKDEIVEEYSIIKPGEPIDIAAIASGSFNVVATINPKSPFAADVKSIRFDSTWGERTERMAPFALFGDSASDYAGRDIVEGVFSIKATAYANNRGRGEIVAESFITFSFDEVSETIVERNPWLWPFDEMSIWNIPIGSDAEYLPVNLIASRGVGIDVKHFLELNANDPEREVLGFTRFAPRNGRSSGDVYMNGLSVPLPDNWLVPDIGSSNPYGLRPNSSFVFRMPDGIRSWNGPAIARPTAGGPLYMYAFVRFPNNRHYDDLFGDGVSNTGGQGASSMSGLGGTIRLGELTGKRPLRHAIKINPWGRHLHYSNSVPGYRWPATSADQYANDSSHKNSYQGDNPHLVMGSLLAIRPEVTPESLGITTEPARRLLWVLQNYGAYITEDAGWDVFDFIIERGVETEFEESYGFSMKSDLWENEVLKIASEFVVVSNNSPSSIGGGGVPLQPLAPVLSPTKN